MNRFALAAVVGAVISAASAVQAQVPERMDWRLKTSGSALAVAIAFTPVRNGSQYATVMMRLVDDHPIDDSGRLYRGMEMNFEVQCSQNRWRMIDGHYRDAGYAVVMSSSGNEWAPLDRSQPLQTLVADVCTGAHNEAIGLRNADVVSAQRWLDGRIVR